VSARWRVAKALAGVLGQSAALGSEAGAPEVVSASGVGWALAAASDGAWAPADVRVSALISHCAASALLELSGPAEGPRLAHANPV